MLKVFAGLCSGVLSNYIINTDFQQFYKVRGWGEWVWEFQGLGYRFVVAGGVGRGVGLRLTVAVPTTAFSGQFCVVILHQSL